MYLGSVWSWASPDSNKTSIAHTPAGPLKFNLQGNNIDNALLEDQIPVEHHHVWVLSLLGSSLIPIITIKLAEKFHLSKPKAGQSCTFLFNNHTVFLEKKLKNLMLWNFFQKNPFNPKKTWEFLGVQPSLFRVCKQPHHKKKLPSEGPTWRELPVPFPADPWTRGPEKAFSFVSFLGGFKI